VPIWMAGNGRCPIPTCGSFLAARGGWTSPEPRACQSANSRTRGWARSTRTRTATHGSGSSPMGTEPGRCCLRWPAPTMTATPFNGGCPRPRSRWRPSTPPMGRLGEDGSGISSWRLWRIMKRRFSMAAEVVEQGPPALAMEIAAGHAARDEAHAFHPPALRRRPARVPVSLPAVQARHGDGRVRAAGMCADGVGRVKPIAGCFGGDAHGTTEAAAHEPARKRRSARNQPERR
jgi:hypothetical protein